METDMTIDHQLDVFSDADVDRIVELGDSLVHIEGRIKGDKVDHKVRDSKIAWVHPDPETHWIFSKAIKVFQSGLPFSTLQSMQYTVYYKGGHYDWHKDVSGIGDAVMRARVNAAILQLSHPHEYKGGVVQIKTGEEVLDVMKKKGMVTSFPIDTLHKVTPVTSGIRKTLIMWGLK